MNTRRVFGYGLIPVLFALAFTALSLTGCKQPVAPPSVTTPPETPDLSGDITISPNIDVTTGMELTAAYSGDETVNYQWKRNKTAVGTDSNKFTPDRAGTYTVTVSATGYNSKTSDAVVVTVAVTTPPETPDLSGDITISPNTDVTTGMELTAAYSGNETINYQWNKGETAIFGATGQRYSPTEAGTYTVTVSATGYNSKTSDAVVVTVAVIVPIEPPDLSGDITISPNTDVTTGMELTAAYSGNETISYQWNKGETAIFGATGQRYSPTEAGTYTVTVSATGYNSKTSDAVVVTVAVIVPVEPPDLPGTITISPNTDVTTGMELTAAYSGYETISYQWNKDETFIFGATGQRYSPDEAGTYTVTVSATGYKPKTSDPVDVTVAVTVPVEPPSGLVEMVWVPGGSFQMGDTAGGGFDDELPVHTVTLTGFYMGKYEVTQAQYEEVMGINPGNNPEMYYGVGDNYPVYNVSWYDAVEFCNELSEMEGLQPVYTISGTTVTANWNRNGYRLPTEAQWEYAAKGGNGSPGNYTYSGSDTIDDVAWHWDNSGSTTHAVGTKLPNGLGIYDMNGNVCEWCWDWYDNYSSSTQTDPTGPIVTSEPERVRRGGNFFSPPEFARSAIRYYEDPSDGGFYHGFRLVRP